MALCRLLRTAALLRRVTQQTKQCTSKCWMWVLALQYFFGCSSPLRRVINPGESNTHVVLWHHNIANKTVDDLTLYPSLPSLLFHSLAHNLVSPAVLHFSCVAHLLPSLSAPLVLKQCTPFRL